MSVYRKRVIYWGLAVSIGVLLIFNLYIGTWSPDPTSSPLNEGPLESERNRHLQDTIHEDTGNGTEIRAHVIWDKWREELVGAAERQEYIQHEADVKFSYEDHQIWPDPRFEDDDRILAQMKNVPKEVRLMSFREKRGLKMILVYTRLVGWDQDVTTGQQTFINQKCPVNACYLTEEQEYSETADVILFRHMAARPPGFRPPYQSWILFLLESPEHTPSYAGLRGDFNWTATYRRDSTIVTPYGKFVPYSSSVLIKEQTRNYAEGKTRKVAWFVSNCEARNGRTEYARALAEHIQVHIYGLCGPLKCLPEFRDQCFDKLNREYKFYLSFENSNCRDYITEKLFVNGLRHNVIPIVMGAAPEDYRRVAPTHSYIHVEDFESPKALADYLHLLDQNDALYNEYFKWKGTGEFIDTHFWCRLCAFAHDTHRPPSWFVDVENWWRGESVCIGNKTWTDYRKRTNIVSINIHG